MKSMNTWDISGFTPVFIFPPPSLSHPPPSLPLSLRPSHGWLLRTQSVLWSHSRQSDHSYQASWGFQELRGIIWAGCTQGRHSAPGDVQPGVSLQAFLSDGSVAGADGPPPPTSLDLKDQGLLYDRTWWNYAELHDFWIIFHTRGQTQGVLLTLDYSEADKMSCCGIIIDWVCLLSSDKYVCVWSAHCFTDCVRVCVCFEAVC